VKDTVFVTAAAKLGVGDALAQATVRPRTHFAQCGWTGPFMDDHRRRMREALNTMGALLLGRVTYDIWARYWPSVSHPGDEIARMLNTVPKYVASTTMPDGSWSETIVIDDVPSQVGDLKQQPGKDMVVMGSSGLAQSLIGHQLVTSEDRFDYGC
jgi:dihydrofolate reductase